MNDEPIRIIVTGGTFDKYYDEIKGTLTFRETHLPEILKLVRIVSPVAITQLQLIDSLEMTDEHRAVIQKAIEATPEERIIITHGTDRMAETAKYLGTLKLGKTIVLTGAMVPYKIVGSDALFNFGTAFGSVRLLPHGVYVAMNGRTFAWDNVRKDYDRGVFRPLKDA